MVVKLYESQHTNRNETSVMIVNEREELPVESLRHLHLLYSTAAGETLCICFQGCLPGVLLELNELAALTRVDSEDHALLAVASLAAVEPHRVRVLHSEIGPRERLLVFSHWHTNRTNQNSSWTLP